MGWTHYWTRPTELPAASFTAAADDWRRVREATRVDLAGFDGTGQPRIDAEHIVFNGAAPRCCEPFEIARVEFDRRGRPTVASFCKTEGLPYDVCVQGALIILKHHLQETIRITSDGTDADWLAGRRLVRAELGYGMDFRLDPAEQV